MCTLMSMLAEWAPAGDASVPGGLLGQMVNRYASVQWFADERNTAAVTFSDGVWCSRRSYYTMYNGKACF